MSQVDPTPTGVAVAPPPVLRVVSGNPSVEELAAVVAVLATAVPAPETRGANGTAATPRSAWRDRALLLRRPHISGPRAWRASAWAAR